MPHRQAQFSRFSNGRIGRCSFEMQQGCSVEMTQVEDSRYALSACDVVESANTTPWLSELIDLDELIHPELADESTDAGCPVFRVSRDQMAQEVDRLKRQELSWTTRCRSDTVVTSTTGISIWRISSLEVVLAA